MSAGAHHAPTHEQAGLPWTTHHAGYLILPALQHPWLGLNVTVPLTLAGVISARDLAEQARAHARRVGAVF